MVVVAVCAFSTLHSVCNVNFCNHKNTGKMYTFNASSGEQAHEWQLLCVIICFCKCVCKEEGWEEELEEEGIGEKKKIERKGNEKGGFLALK